METDDSKPAKDAPKLFSLKKQNVYTVPDEFFRELETGIRSKYPLHKRGVLRKMKRFARFSVAAAIAVLILFSGIKILMNKQYLPVETDRSIYTLQDGDKDGE